MSKLSDLVDAAEGNEVPVATLLRMTMTLAARLKTPPLAEWVNNELVGYPEDAPVPSYRGPFPVQVVGDWSGPFQSNFKLAIPSSRVPAGIVETGGFDVTFRQSVSELERLAKADAKLGASWDPNIVARLNGAMRDGSVDPIVPMHGLAAAYQEFSPALVESVLDNVRTRVLGLALDLETIAPDAGEPGVKLDDTAGVIKIINTYIYGQGNAVAVDSPGAIQAAAVTPGDLESLLNAASAYGLSTEQLTELEEAIDADQSEETPDPKPGSRVSEFIGKLTLGTLKSAGQAGVQQAAKAVGDMVRAYYGI